ncbi:MAG: tetratricopeptide repeat protein [Rhodanobacteraceae bacterium]
MAFDDFDEYEQSEQVRKWLRENGLSIVIGVVLALALIFGWRQWQAHRASHGAQAAERYAALQTALAAGQTAQANSAAETLEKDYADSPYAALGAAARADLAVAQGKLDEAHAALQWAVDHEKTAPLHSLYLLRLTRVELAQGNASQALAHLQSVPAQDYRAIAQELRGDALLKLGRAADARAAYTVALAAMSKDAAPGQRQSLQMKLDDLASSTRAQQPGKQGT